MCEYCGCREVPAIAELRDEHHHLLDEVDHLRRALAAGDHEGAAQLLTSLVAHLGQHVSREEHGIFTALRDQGDYTDEVGALEGEHRWRDAAIGGLRPGSTEFADALTALFDALEAHIEREDLGVFPVSVVTLGAEGWDLVDAVHHERPSFLDGLTRS
jgi:hemerythrin-like domain-containing protein